MPWQPLWVARLHHLPDNITDNNCTDGIQWIYHILSDCVWDAKGIASEILGLASLVTWMIVSIPQMVKNFRHIQGIEGVSLMLILMWTLGDTANLVGGMLTKQLPLQIYLAVYFVFADLILFGQWLYYNLYWKRKRKDYEPIPSSRHKSFNGDTPQVVLCITGVLLFSIQGSVKLLNSYYLPTMPYSGSTHPGGRSLLSLKAHNLGYHIHIFNGLEDEVGYGIGIVSSIFYTFSRCGQMYLNYKRRSTDGLSVVMFILAVLGNLTYGLSILVRQLDINYVLKHLPWLIGSLGVILLDLTLLCQFYYYRKKGDFDSLSQQPVSNTDSEVQVIIEPAHTGSIN